MVTLKSLRAKNLLENLNYVRDQIAPQMSKYPYEAMNLWGYMEIESKNVKNLSFFGELNDFQKIILETLAKLMITKPLSRLDELSLRECEAYLRDRNSEASLEGLTQENEEEFKRILQWIKTSLRTHLASNSFEKYSFPLEKGSFARLKLVDKIHELKAFLGSNEVWQLYRSSVAPELIDVEDLTAFIRVSYESESEKELFDKLHTMAVEVFREEDLNFIPEF